MAIKLHKTQQRFSLPTSFSKIRENLSDYSLLIYGMAGEGKTTFTQQFPDPFHLMTEPGGKALRLKQRQPRSVKEAETFVSLWEEAEDFSNIVCDTVEALYDLFWAAALKKLKIEHPADEPYGKGWDAVRSPFLKLLKRIINHPTKGGILISHVAHGTRKLSDGDEVEDFHPNLSGKPLEEVCGAVDLVGFYHQRKGAKVLQIRATEDAYAKCRLEDHFNYSDGSRVRYIPMGDSKEEAYQNFVAAFNNELEKPAEKPKGKAKLKRRRK